jgi:hypothetical protein
MNTTRVNELNRSAYTKVLLAFMILRHWLNAVIPLEVVQLEALQNGIPMRDARITLLDEGLYDWRSQSVATVNARRLHLHFIDQAFCALSKTFLRSKSKWSHWTF